MVPLSVLVGRLDLIMGTPASFDAAHLALPSFLFSRSCTLSLWAFETPFFHPPVTFPNNITLHFSHLEEEVEARGRRTPPQMEV